MKYLVIALVALLTFSASPAMAEHSEETFHSVDLSLRSYHFNDRCYDGCTKAFNENNIGIGVTYYVTDHIAVLFGVYKNSFNKTSLYNAFNISRTMYKNGSITVKPGFALGIANGYNDLDGVKVKHASESGTVPIISPNVSIYKDRFHVNVAFMPSADTVIGILRAGVRF